MKSIWPPPTAYCSRPTAFQEPQVRRAGPALLLSARCLLNLSEAGWRDPFSGLAAKDTMSPQTGKEKNGNFQK